MLYAPIGTGKPLRVQGSFVSDEEREEVVRFIKQNSEAQYSDDIIAQIEKSAAEADKKSGPAPEADKPPRATMTSCCRRPWTSFSRRSRRQCPCCSAG